MVEHFKGGYHARFVQHTEVEHPHAWNCNHGCTHAIQLISNATKQVVMEWCEIEAENIAGLLLEAVDQSTRSIPDFSHPAQDSKCIS